MVAIVDGSEAAAKRKTMAMAATMRVTRAMANGLLIDPLVCLSAAHPVARKSEPFRNKARISFTGNDAKFR